MKISIGLSRKVPVGDFETASVFATAEDEVEELRLVDWLKDQKKIDIEKLWLIVNEAVEAKLRDVTKAGSKAMYIKPTARKWNRVQ